MKNVIKAFAALWLIAGCSYATDEAGSDSLREAVQALGRLKQQVQQLEEDPEFVQLRGCCLTSGALLKEHRAACSALMKSLMVDPQYQEHETRVQEYIDGLLKKYPE